MSEPCWVRDRQKWWRLGGAWQTPGEAGAGSEASAALGCPDLLGTFGNRGSPFARWAWPWHPRVPAGGMELGGCRGIQRTIPAGPSSLPVPLAPAQPPARAELCRSRRDGSRRLRAVVSHGRPGHAGARSAPPCSVPASSTRLWWRARAASWATCTARGARRASRLAPPGPSAVPGSRGQVGEMGLPGEGLGVPARCLFRGWGGHGGKVGCLWRGAGQDLRHCGWRLRSPRPSPCWGWRGGQDQAPLTPGAGAGEEPPVAGWGCADMPGTSRWLACAIRTEIVR